MRGQVYEIDEKKIFTFGGAQSHDIQGGILQLDEPDFKAKKKELDKGVDITTIIETLTQKRFFCMNR